MTQASEYQPPSAGRAGSFVIQASGFAAFIPAPLPPNPLVDLDRGLVRLLIDAAGAIGRLDGVLNSLPCADAVAAGLLRTEALASARLADLTVAPDEIVGSERQHPSGRVSAGAMGARNIVSALTYVTARAREGPPSLRLLSVVHSILLRNLPETGGGFPGAFRVQDRPGPRTRAGLDEATVAPPAAELPGLLAAFETFLRDEEATVPLIHAGLAMAQFHLVGPFAGGNGRTARVLAILLLVQAGLLRRPALCLSAYLIRHQTEYETRVLALRDAGDWEAWLRFWLQGVREVADQAMETGAAVQSLFDEQRTLLLTRFRLPTNPLALLELLAGRPVINTVDVTESLGITFPTANHLLRRFVELGIVIETTGQRRYRRFRYDPFTRLFAS